MKPSIKEKILEVLRNHGPMTIKEVKEVAGLKGPTVYKRLYELRVDGKVIKDEDTGEYKAISAEEKTCVCEAKSSPGRFSKVLEDIGVNRDIVSIITEIFFSGDINSPIWLNKVLREYASGYIQPKQANIMLHWWGAVRIGELVSKFQYDMDQVTFQYEMDRNVKK